MKRIWCLGLLASLVLVTAEAQRVIPQATRVAQPAAMTELRIVALPGRFQTGGFSVNEMEGSLLPNFIMVEGQLVMWHLRSHANSLFDRDLNLLRAYNGTLTDGDFPNPSGVFCLFPDGNYCQVFSGSTLLKFYDSERRLQAEVNLESYDQAQTVLRQQTHPSEQLRPGSWTRPTYFGSYCLLMDGTRNWGGISNSQGQVSFDRAVIERFRTYNFQSLNWTRYNPVLAGQMQTLLKDYNSELIEGARYTYQSGSISSKPHNMPGTASEAVKRLLQDHFDRLGYDFNIDGSLEPVPNGFIIWERWNGVYLSLTHNRIYSLPFGERSILLWNERDLRVYYVQSATQSAWQVRIMSLDFLQPPATTVDGGPVPPPPPPFVIPPEAIDRTVTRYFGPGPNQVATTTPAPTPGATPAAIRITALSASSTLTEPANLNAYHPATVFDGKADTGWFEAVTGPGVGQWLEVSFEQPVRVDRITVSPGWLDARYWRQNNRIQTMTITVDGAQATVARFTDTMASQSVQLAQPVTGRTWRFRIDAVYPNTRWDDTTITELGFWLNGVQYRVDLGTFAAGLQPRAP